MQKNNNIKVLQRRINSLKFATQIEQISTGFSPDKKYVVYFNTNEKYLLRTGEIAAFERKNAEFEILNTLQEYKVHCCELAHY